jgi:hypothetical protein
MTDQERVLLIMLAGLACSDLSAKRPASDPHADTVLRMNIHNLLILMRDICTDNGYPPMFTEEQMKAMLS